MKKMYAILAAVIGVLVMILVVSMIDAAKLENGKKETTAASSEKTETTAEVTKTETTTEKAETTEKETEEASSAVKESLPFMTAYAFAAAEITKIRDDGYVDLKYMESDVPLDEMEHIPDMTQFGFDDYRFTGETGELFLFSFYNYLVVRDKAYVVGSGKDLHVGDRIVYMEDATNHYYVLIYSQEAENGTVEASGETEE